LDELAAWAREGYPKFRAQARTVVRKKPLALISFKKFGNLRLSDFVSNKKIEQLTDWEFEEELWVGEALGFSEWLCKTAKPKLLRSLSIDFDNFPAAAAKSVLGTIGLPFVKRYVK
jgi:hypothetical protein